MVHRPAKELFTCPSVVDYLHVIREHFLGDFTAESAPGPMTYTYSPSGSTIIHIKGATGQLHTAPLCSDVALPRPRVYTYDPVAPPTEPYHTHALMLWFKHHMVSFHQSHQGADLTLMPISMTTNLQRIWGLVFGGTIVSADFHDEKYSTKLQAFENYLIKFRAQNDYKSEELWDWYIEGSRVATPLPIIKYLTEQATEDELEHILRYVMSRLPVNELKDKLVGKGGQMFVDWYNGLGGNDKCHFCIYRALHHLINARPQMTILQYFYHLVKSMYKLCYRVNETPV